MTRRALGALAAVLAVMVAGSVALAVTFAPPPSNALDILWNDYCLRTTDPLCAVPTPTPSATPSSTPTPTPTPTATASPSPTPTPSPTPSPTATPTPTSTPIAGSDSLLIDKAALLSRPTSGSGWSNITSWAAKSVAPNLSDQDNQADVQTLAQALVYARTGDAAMRTKVINALSAVRGTESGSRALAVGRGLAAYVLSADLIGYHDPTFMAWVSGMRTFATTGGPGSLTACANERPNNWGAWCRVSLVAANLYLDSGITHDVALFGGWLGDRSQYAGYSYGDLSWQANSSAPVGINPTGATKSGHSIDGVLPDDQRRAGGFSWPPPCENYVAEALQGVTLEATLLERAGQPALGWSDSAIKRAAQWRLANGCSFTSDDAGTNSWYHAFYGLALPASGTPGKGWGFQDWLWP